MKTTCIVGILVVGWMMASAASTLAADKPGIHDALAAKVSFAWDNDSLASGLLALEKMVKAEHPGFRIRIVGGDLQFEGITRNQRVRGVKLEDDTVAEVLTALVLKANPISLVKDSRDPRLKLVWVIGADPAEPGVQAVLVTTRKGAAKRGEKLPEVFLPR
ncbi:MAG: hypothetical protein RIC55_20160 [Pirellulaceae bacterium]